MRENPRPFDLGAVTPASEEAVSRIRVDLQRWTALESSDDAVARAALAPVLAEKILRLPDDFHGPERIALVDPILRRGVTDARALRDPVALLNVTCLLLQFCEVSAADGEALIDESLPGLAAASVPYARTFRMVAAEFLFGQAYRPTSDSPREELLRRALALVQPLVAGSFEPHLEWQHLVLAARLLNELGQGAEAAPMLQRATTLVPSGSEEWGKAAIELGLTLNDLGEHEAAAHVLQATLPLAHAAALQPPGPPPQPHRGHDLSDVAGALAESLAQLQLADQAFEVMGLAFVDDDGTAAPCDLSAMCAQLADDELGLLLCVNNATTMFLFDRAEALRVRVIANASIIVWLETLDASGWLHSALGSAGEDRIPAAVAQLNDALRSALGGLESELGRYRSLVVIPHRTLCLLPFWLMDACAGVAVRSVPAPGMLASTGVAPARGRMLSVADPNQDLPSAQVESEALRQRIGTAMEFERLVGAECSSARVLASLPAAGLLHFAGHALSDLVDPMRSSLELHAGPGESRFLDAGAILQLDLRGLGLVVLSACSSGVPELRIDSVTRLAGLAATLIKQGVGTVVSTMWEIGDEAAALVIDRLFAELLTGQRPYDVPAALKRATQHVRAMSAADATSRIEQIVDGSNGELADAAQWSVDRLRASRARAPFSGTDQWGAFFTSGARFLHVETGVLP